MIYPGLYSGAIGSLLRQIQEQKSQSPIIPPGSEVSTAPREIVEQPNQSLESPGTQRMVSIRPEASNVAGPGNTLDAPDMAGILPTGEDGGVVGPVVTRGTPMFKLGPNTFARPGELGGKGDSVQEAQDGERSVEFRQENTQSVSQPSAQVRPQINQTPPDRGSFAPLDLSKSNELIERADKFIANTNKEAQNTAALTNYLRNPNDPTALDAYRQTYKQPAQKTTSTPQVLGVSTQKQSQPSAASKMLNTLKQSPISWLATKIFKR